jgi:hypothetical protein
MLQISKIVLKIIFLRAGDGKILRREGGTVKEEAHQGAGEGTDL